MKIIINILLLLLVINVFSQENTDTLDVNEVDFFDLSFDELSQISVSTASKVDEGFQDAPSNLTIITADEIIKFGAVSLVDVLERATSMIMTGSYIYPQNISSMRGDLSSDFDNHILILIDGNPYRGSITEGINFPFYLSFPLSAIDRIEIIRGPGSVLYGTNAYQGVINVITKTNKNDGLSGITAVSHGSYESIGTESTVLYKKNDFNLIASFKYFDEKGWAFEAMDYDSIIRKTNFGEQNLGVLLSAKYKKISFTGFLANSYQDNIDDWDTIAPGGVNVNHFFINFGYNDTLAKHWKTNFDLTFNYDKNNLDFAGGYQNGKSNDVLLDFYNIFDIGNKIDLLVGGNLLLNKGHLNSVIQDDSLIYIFNDIPTYRELNYIGYANINYYPIEQIKLIAGVQVNKPQARNIDFVPRFGAIFNLDNGFGFKINYAHAYGSPSLLERNYSTIGIIGNPNLLPEKIKTLDLQMFYNKNDYQLSITYFNSQQENLIGIVHYDNYYNIKYYENKDKIYSGGIELEGKMYITKALYLNTNMTYQLSVSDSSIDNTYRKLYMFKMGVAYDIFRGINIAAFNTYYHNHLNNDDIACTRHYNMTTLKTSVNFSELLSFNKQNNIIFSVYLYNLFDEKIIIPDIIGSTFNSIPAKQGRSIYGSVIFVF